MLCPFNISAGSGIDTQNELVEAVDDLYEEQEELQEYVESIDSDLEDAEELLDAMDEDLEQVEEILGIEDDEFEFECDGECDDCEDPCDYDAIQHAFQISHLSIDIHTRKTPFKVKRY